jgi:MoaA/NifB/PqqE/SkfB family radical SAM enzyme
MDNATSIFGGASGPARKAIIQIHPSRKCNLSCPHCYSESGPKIHEELDVEVVCKVVSDAALMGYQVVSISGGEPMMYKGLLDVLNHAKSLGMFTTITTNGFFNRQERLSRLQGLVDVMAISFDGPPAIHNEIRGSSSAFERLEEGLESVRQSGIPFGFIHTLTKKNWEHLLWVAEFAEKNGAQLLQLHPLELNGRAENQMREHFLNEEDLAKIYVLSFALMAKYSEKMKLQLDLLYRDHILEEPSLVYAEELNNCSFQKPPAQSIGLLVLEPDGVIVPISYGFSRRYMICDVRNRGLSDSWPNYLLHSYHSFKSLCRQVWEEVSAPESPILVNWHEAIVNRSHTMTVR